MRIFSMVSIVGIVLSISVFFISCNDPVSPKSFSGIFKVKSNSIPNVASNPDAVTKASNILDSLFVRIDSIPKTDSIMNITLDWGDNSNINTYAGNKFTLGANYVGLTHWYTRAADTINGFCTTKATITTFGGTAHDTTFRVKVLKKGSY